MKLCIFSDASSLHISEWAQFFAHKGYEVSIITDNPSEISGVAIYPFPKFEMTFHVPFISTFYQIIMKIIVIRRLLKTIQPDLIHSHFANIYGFLGSFSGFHPQILTCHGSDLLVHPKRSKIEKYFVKRALKYADKITLPSKEMSQKSIIYGANPQKITIVQYGIDLQIFKYSNKDKQNNRFLCTRMLTSQYNTGFIIDAFYLLLNKFPDMILDIVGDGSERENLEKLTISKSMEKSVTFWGKINHSEIVEFYSRSSFYITSSPTDGLSISLLEAFATGVYPILPDNKSNRSLADLGFNVKLYSLDNINCLVSAFDDVLRDTVKLPQICKQNRSLVEEKFDRSKNLALVETLYLNMFKGDSK